MGNIGSQAGHQISHKESPSERQWAHSFPRTHPPKTQQIKVLPERDSRQKLRATNNGEILQSGGTLSGRQQSRNIVVDKTNHEYKENGPLPKSYMSNQRYSFHKLGYKSNYHLQQKHNNSNINIASQKALKEQMKLFGSAPDLRYSTQNQETTELRSKKKYKAPPPPNNRINEKSEWEENSSDNDLPVRKMRLFKTRAETKKHSSHVNKIEIRDLNNTNNELSSVNLRIHSQERQNFRQNRLSLPEIKLSENLDFQKELKLATKKLRNTKSYETNKTTIEYNLINTSGNRSSADGKEKEKLKTLDPTKENLLKKKFKQIMEDEENNNINSINSNIRGEPSGKESSSQEMSPNVELKDKSCFVINEKPKSFYFGMDHIENSVTAYVNDHFSGINLKNGTKQIQHSSESDVSSDMELLDDNEAGSSGIDLQLRPILPKKQLEIPRFSPAAAWKLLSSIDNDPATGTVASDDLPVLVEERIEKFARPPPPNIQVGPRSNNDKSGDSGISGDAGPPGYEDNAEVILNGKNDIQEPRFFGAKESISWTPQQDLEDDSSLEELNLETSVQKSRRLLPYINRPHVFSLSLPRDNHLASYMIEKTYSHYTGLQRLKRSVSGVLSNLSNNKKDLTQSHANQEDGSNWFFSKSAPNSLNNGFNSLEIKNNHQDSSSNNKTSSRLMYLPESANTVNVKGRDENRYKLSAYSKSCEDLSAETKKRAPEMLQDPPKDISLERNWKSSKKPKKFTFQSTVRQIERRRMAEKLSKEAEKKEKQRLRELEAMQRVEEEFQKKRAREKATIRHQLRLYCMDDNSGWSSLPPSLKKNEERQDPDGAFSSSSSSPLPPKSQESVRKNPKFQSDGSKGNHPPATQELSEYRQAQIDYKEFRGNVKYSPDERYSKQTTVHPQITCNMPKAKGTTHGIGNYRKDFAYGVKMSRSAGSTHSEDSQTTSPKVYHSKYAPLTRF